jgi:hypothetical protein
VVEKQDEEVVEIDGLELDDDEYFVENILDKKILPVSNEPLLSTNIVFQTRTDYLVKWLGYGDADNSWVREEDIESSLVQRYNSQCNSGKKELDATDLSSVEDMNLEDLATFNHGKTWVLYWKFVYMRQKIFAARSRKEVIIQLIFAVV